MSHFETFTALFSSFVIIDREAGEIIHLVVSVRLSMCLLVLSCLNRFFVKKRHLFF